MSDWVKGVGLGGLGIAWPAPNQRRDLEPTKVPTHSPAVMAGLGMASPTLLTPSCHQRKGSFVSGHLPGCAVHLELNGSLGIFMCTNLSC